MKKKVKVLIADDNRNYCNVLKDIIEGDDLFDVVGIAHDGVSALDMIQLQKPDLVILDIIMPMLDGLGVLEKAKAFKKEERPKFIVMSAVGHDEITFKAVNLGASYYVVKPFDMVEFLKRLNQFVEHTEERSIYIKGNLSEDTLNGTVIAQLREFGVPIHIKGYQYLQDAISIVIKDPTALNKITKFIYPPIADRYETTGSRVERAIRNAIDLTFVRGNQEHLNRFFNDVYPNYKKMTNSEFIAVVADKLRTSR